MYGYIAVYSCNVGSIFVEGGRVRTSVCTDGQWTPADVPGCQGNRDANYVSKISSSLELCRVFKFKLFEAYDLFLFFLNVKL